MERVQVAGWSLGERTKDVKREVGSLYLIFRLSSMWCRCDCSTMVTLVFITASHDDPKVCKCMCVYVCGSVLVWLMINEPLVPEGLFRSLKGQDHEQTNTSRECRLGTQSNTDTHTHFTIFWVHYTSPPHLNHTHFLNTKPCRTKLGVTLWRSPRLVCDLEYIPLSGSVQYGCTVKRTWWQINGGAKRQGHTRWMVALLFNVEFFIFSWQCLNYVCKYKHTDTQVQFYANVWATLYVTVNSK